MRIVAEVVRTWFTAVGSGQEMRTQQAAVETQRRSLELLLMRHAVGDASLADVDAAQARLAAAEASLPGIRARERAAGFRSEEHTSELQSLMRISYAVFC